MNGLLLAARLVLAGVFGLSAVAKLLDRPGSRQSMHEFGVPATLAGPLGMALPLAELACALALMPAASAWWGAAGALVLLALFTAAIILNLARGRTPDCHCFGRIHSEPVGSSTLVRNAVLIGAAAFVVGQGSGGTGPGLVAWLLSLDRSDSILLGMATAFGALAVSGGVAVIQLLTQNGRLMLRIEAIEAKLGGRGALESPAEAGLSLKAEAPPFTARDLDGGPVTLRSLAEGGKPLLLVFSEPACAACDQAMPDIARWQREHDDQLRVVVISRGDKATNQAKAAAYGVRHVLLQTNREIAEAYRVALTPSAVLIKNGEIASQVAAGDDAIYALVFANTLPPAVKQGDPTPRLEVPALEGEALDIASLKA